MNFSEVMIVSDNSGKFATTFVIILSPQCNLKSIGKKQISSDEGMSYFCRGLLGWNEIFGDGC
ncbi:hypothetical protein [Xenorhabdus mauleonii]|nr:hypothetical protein [Xenorhabdus mauleonii]